MVVFEITRELKLKSLQPWRAMCKFPHRGKENACTERKQKLEGLNRVHSFLWVSPREERRVFFSLLDSMVIADCEKTLLVFQLYLFLFSFYISSFDQDVGKSAQTEKILRSHSSNKEGGGRVGTGRSPSPWWGNRGPRRLSQLEIESRLATD